MEANLAKHRARAPRARGAGHAAVRRACAPGAIVAMAAFAAMASAQPVAVVTDVTGAVASSAGGPIAILASVSAGERLRLAPASRVALLYYGDGAQYDARGAGEVVVEASKPRAESVMPCLFWSIPIRGSIERESPMKPSALAIAA